MTFDQQMRKPKGLLLVSSIPGYRLPLDLGGGPCTIIEVNTTLEINGEQGYPVRTNSGRILVVQASILERDDRKEER
jgi:hypothetical protein